MRSYLYTVRLGPIHPLEIRSYPTLIDCPSMSRSLCPLPRCGVTHTGPVQPGFCHIAMPHQLLHSLATFASAVHLPAIAVTPAVHAEPILASWLAWHSTTLPTHTIQQSETHHKSETPHKPFNMLLRLLLRSQQMRGLAELTTDVHLQASAMQICLKCSAAHGKVASPAYTTLPSQTMPTSQLLPEPLQTNTTPLTAPLVLLPAHSRLRQAMKTWGRGSAGAAHQHTRWLLPTRTLEPRLPEAACHCLETWLLHKKTMSLTQHLVPCKLNLAQGAIAPIWSEQCSKLRLVRSQPKEGHLRLAAHCILMHSRLSKHSMHSRHSIHSRHSRHSRGSV